MVAMAAFNGAAALHIDPERGAVQGLLDVVHRQRVAGEQDVDVAMPDEIAEVLSTAGVDDDRADDEGDALTRLLRRPHHRRDAGHTDFDAALGRNLVGHEREAVAVAFLELRHDLDAVDAADHGVALADLAKLAADRPAGVDDDRRIHPLALDFDPLAVTPDEGLMIG